MGFNLGFKGLSMYKEKRSHSQRLLCLKTESVTMRKLLFKSNQMSQHSVSATITGADSTAKEVGYCSLPEGICLNAD